MKNVVNRIRPEMLVLYAALTVVLTGLGGWLYLLQKPNTEYWRLRETRTRVMQDVELVQRGVEAGEIGELEQTVKSLESRLFGRGANLPPGQMVSYIIGELDRLSDRHAIRLISVRPGDPSRVLIFEEIPFDVEVSGQYFDLFKWLQDTERELRPMVLKQFRIRPGGERDLLNMSLRLVSYRTKGNTT